MFLHWLFSTVLLGIFPFVLKIFIFSLCVNEWNVAFNPTDFIILTLVINSNIIFEKFFNKYVKRWAYIVCLINSAFLCFMYLSEIYKFNYSKSSLTFYVFLLSGVSIFIAGKVYYKIDKS